MFDFLRRSASRPVSEAIFQAIKRQGLMLPPVDPARLRMVLWQGRFSDRQVTYFRIFDPVVMARHSLDIQRYRDLDAFPGLVLHVGHVESDGNVVMKPAGPRSAESTGGRRPVRIIPAVSAEPRVASGAGAALSPSSSTTAGSTAPS